MMPGVDANKQLLIDSLKDRLNAEETSKKLTERDRKIVEDYVQALIHNHLSASNWEVLLQAIKGPVDAPVVDDNLQRTALMLAAINGNEQDVKLLVALGAHLEARDSDGNTALIYAAKRGQVQTVKMMTDELGADANAVNDFGDSPLICAAYFGHTPCVDILVKGRAQLELTNHEGNTAFVSAINEKHWRTAHALSKLGAVMYPCNLEEKNAYGDTALLYAIKTHHWGDVQALIALGSDMHATDKYGYTPQMLLANIDDKSLLEHCGIHMQAEDRKRAKMEYAKLPNLIKVIKEAGHVLGFTRTILGIESTTMYNRVTGYGLLNKFLENLPSELHSSTLNQYYKPQDSMIREALDCSVGYLREHNSMIRHKNIIQNHHAGKPTILPISWPGHAMTLVAWNDLLIVCNRGDNKFEHSISVFKIPGGHLTETFLQAVMPQNEPSAGQVLKGIADFVDLRNPILTLPAQDQKYSTCGFVNLKASLQPILCFIKLLELKKTKDLNSALLEPLTHKGLATDPLLKVSIEEAKKEYKHFTEFMRDKQVIELCETFKNLPKNELRERKAYVEILTAILNEHHGQPRNSKGRLRSPEKISAETKRAGWILSTLSQNEQSSPLITTAYNAAVERSTLSEPLPENDSAASSFRHPNKGL